MKFLKTFTFLFIIITTLSCLDLRTCNKSSVGKYICENNQNAENYVVLNSDGTFYHYYKEGEVELTDTGTWKESGKGHCALQLSNWKNFNEKGLNYSKFGSWYFWSSNGYLDNTPDGQNSTSFKKI